MRQALERMKYHNYAAIPIIDDSGKYTGTLTKEDLLLKMKKTPGLTVMNFEKILLKEIKMHTQNSPVFVDTQIEDLVSRSNKQYFVPVTDDGGIFIGIVRHSEFFRYCTNYLNKPINY